MISFINPYIFGAGGPPPPTPQGDPFFYNVELILIADTGTNTLIDQSINQRTLTPTAATVDQTLYVSSVPYLLRDIVWNGSLFVTVGANGAILTSTDGITWTQRTSDTLGVLYGVSWTGSIFVAFGANGILLTSTDGITWTQRISDTTENLYAIAWTSGGLLVVVGANGAIITSTDGITWTQQTSGTIETLYDIVWNGSIFVAVGTNGTVLTSTDGITWTQQTSGTTQTLYDIVWNGSIFVAVGTNGVILSSTDGVSWAVRTSGTSETIYRVIWNGSIFVAVGTNGVILTSTNGITWALRTSGTSQTLYSVVWNGSIFVAFGDNGVILTSTDGITWALRTSGTTQTLYDIVWNGSLFVAVGTNGTILTSPDGIIWTIVPIDNVDIASINLSGPPSRVQVDENITWMHDGLTPWTFETWLYLDTLPTTRYTILSNFGVTPVPGVSGYLHVYVINDSGYAKIKVDYSGTGGTFTSLTSTTAVAIDTWTHLVVAFDGSNLSIYLSGAIAGTTLIIPGFIPGIQDTVNLNIGSDSYPPGTNSLDGNLQDLQITRGLDRYTFTDFDPSTEPYIEGSSTVGGDPGDPTYQNTYLYIPFDSVPALAGGRRAEAYTSGQCQMSLYGSAGIVSSPVKFGANALNIPSTATSYVTNNNIQVEDFVLYSQTAEATYDCWCYPFVAQMAAGNSGIVFALRSGVGTVDDYSSALQVALRVGITQAGILTCHISDSAANLTATNGGSWRSVASNTKTVNDQQWNHIRVAVQNGRIGIWLNGVKDNDTQVPTGIVLGGRDKVWLGAMDTLDTYNFAGYIDDFKIMSAVTFDFNQSEFTVPTTPGSPYFAPGSQIPCTGPDRHWVQTGLPPSGPVWGIRNSGTGELYFNRDQPGSVVVTDDCTVFVAGYTYWRYIAPLGDPLQLSTISRVFTKSEDGGNTLSILKDFYPYRITSEQTLPYNITGTYDPYSFYSGCMMATYGNTVYIIHNTGNGSPSSQYPPQLTAQSYTIVSRSTNKGSTWTHSISTTNNLTTVAAVATNNGLYQIGSDYYAEDQTYQASPGYPSSSYENVIPSLFIARSTDHGKTWSQTMVAQNYLMNGYPKYSWYSGDSDVFSVAADSTSDGNVGVLFAAFYPSDYRFFYVRPTSATTWASPVPVPIRSTPPSYYFNILQLLDSDIYTDIVLSPSNYTMFAVGQKFNSAAFLITIDNDLNPIGGSGISIGTFQYGNDTEYNVASIAVSSTLEKFIAVNKVGFISSKNQALIIKLSATNTLIWQSRIAGGSALIRDIKVDSVGDVYITYRTGARIVKVSGVDGTILGQVENTYSYANDIVVDSSNNVYTVGYGGLSPYSSWCTLTKRDSGGTILWSKTYGDPAYNLTADYAFDFPMKVDSSGNIIFSGRVTNGPVYSIFVAKVDSSGTPIWFKYFVPSGHATGNPYSKAMAVDQEDNIYIVGSNNNLGPGGGLTVTAISSSGTLIWDRTVTNNSAESYGDAPVSILVNAGAQTVVISVRNKLIALPIMAGTVSSSGWTFSSGTPTINTLPWSSTTGSEVNGTLTFGAYTNNTSSYTTAAYGQTLTTKYPLSLIPPTGTVYIDINDMEPCRLLCLKNHPGVVLVFAIDYDNNIFMSRSTDNGITWTQPTIVLSAYAYGASNFGYGPSFDIVELENGNVCVLFGGAYLPEGQYWAATYYALSTDGGLTFSNKQWAYDLADIVTHSHDYYFEGYGFKAVASGNDVILAGAGWQEDKTATFRFTPEAPSASTSLTWANISYLYDNPSGNYGLGISAASLHHKICIGNDTYTTYHGVLTKIDQYGNVVWSRAMGDTGVPDYSTSLTVFKFGSNLLTIDAGYLGTQSLYYLSMKEFTQSGTFVGEDHYTLYGVSTSQDFQINFVSASIDSSQNIYVVMTRHEDANYSADFSLNFVEVIKFDSSKAFVWRKKYAASATSGMFSATDSALDSSNNIIITCSSAPTGPGDMGSTILKIDPSGAVIWAKLIGADVNSAAFGLVLDSSNNIYVQGYFANSAQTQFAKLNSSGAVQWCKRYGDSTAFPEESYLEPYVKPAIGSDGKIYISGSAIIPGEYSYVGVAKIEPATGSIIFARKYRTLFPNKHQYNLSGVDVTPNGTIVFDSYSSGYQAIHVASVPYDGSATGNYGTIEYSSVTYNVTSPTPTVTDITSGVITNTPAAPTTLAWTSTIVDATSVYRYQTTVIPSGWTSP